MPAGVVKTKADERYWSEAKKYCGGKYETGSKRYWTCVNGVFGRIKRNAAK